MWYVIGRELFGKHIHSSVLMCCTSHCGCCCCYYSMTDHLSMNKWGFNLPGWLAGWMNFEMQSHKQDREEEDTIYQPPGMVCSRYGMAPVCCIDVTINKGFLSLDTPCCNLQCIFFGWAKKKRHYWQCNSCSAAFITTNWSSWGGLHRDLEVISYNFRKDFRNVKRSWAQLNERS